MPRPALLVAFCLVVVLAGCRSNPVAPLIEETEFAPSLGVDLAASVRTESGLYYRDLRVGTQGTPAVRGRVAEVRYTGWFVDGTRFETNEPFGPPLEFTLGAGQVIPGWEEGIVGMRVGGVRQLIVPPHLGYGSLPRRDLSGRVVIPGNSILVFRVELVGLR